jgi:hypothetical protein
MGGAEEAAETRRPSSRRAATSSFRAFLVLNVCAGVMGWLLYLLVPEAFFRLDTETERLELAIGGESALPFSSLGWRSEGDSVQVDDSVMVFSGEIHLGSGATVTLTRAELGKFRLEVLARGDSFAAAKLKRDDGTQLIARSRFFLTPARDSLSSRTLVFRAAATIGQFPGPGREERLISGTATGAAKSFFGGTRVPVVEVGLHLGDHVSVVGTRTCEEFSSVADGWGTIRVGPTGPMRVVVEATGRSLRLGTSGGSVQCYRPSMLGLVSADPVLQFVLVAAGVLYASTVSALVQSFLRQRRIGG